MKEKREKTYEVKAKAEEGIRKQHDGSCGGLPMDPIYIDRRVKERGIVAGEVNDHDHPHSKNRDLMVRRASN